jgi:hypothetical protein
LVKATRHERCDWETPIREEGVNTLLPHLAETRDAARLLGVEIRVRIRQGRFDEAIHRLRAGFTLAKHVGDGDTLIEGLVGLAIARTMVERVEEFVGQPGAPNLYWALTDLPPAYLNLWQATRWERSFVYIHLPILWEARQRPVSADDLRQALLKFYEITDEHMPARWLPRDERAALVATAAGLVVYPNAQRRLVTEDRSADQVRQMPVADAVVTYIADTYAHLRDDLFKWFALPYPEARVGLARAEADLEAKMKQDPIGTLLPSMVLPALSRSAQRYAEFDRRLALLRCIEAIRIYAADHEGELPESLAAIKTVPVPSDPMTNTPFDWRRKGDIALLKATSEPVDSTSAKSYEITIRR